MTLVVSFEKPAGRFEFAVIPDTSEDIQNFALGGAGVANAVRCKEWQTQRFGQTHRCLVAALFDRIAMALYFDIDILFPQKSRKLLNIVPSFVITAVRQRSRQDSFLATRQTHQSLGMFRDFL